jgi:phosphohistidine phosphatase
MESEAMHAHVCRHAQAEPNSVSGLDFDRPLTREGRLQARYLAGLMSGALPNERPRSVLASPAVRTQQTAQAIADELGLSITTLDELLPMCPAGAAIAAIERHSSAGPVLLVGHNPTVTAVVSILLHGPSAGVCMPGPTLRTGQMATIEVDAALTPGACRLVDLHRYEPALAS